MENVSSPQDESSHQHRARTVEAVIKRRRSTRRFSEQTIPAPLLAKLVEAGIYAPSGSNWQNQRFLVVTDPNEIQRIGAIRWVWPYRSQARERNPSGILGHATALILVFADAARNDFRGRGEYHIWEPLEIQNCAASIQNILLLATAEGIASCWVSASPPMNNTRLLSGQRWHQLLSPYRIPATYKIQGIICLGYPTRTDDEGFPLGEKQHGATLWGSVARGPIEDYLITKAEGSEAKPLGVISKSVLQGLSLTARCLRRLLFAVDRTIERIERSALGIKY